MKNKTKEKIQNRFIDLKEDMSFGFNSEYKVREQIWEKVWHSVQFSSDILQAVKTDVRGW